MRTSSVVYRQSNLILQIPYLLFIVLQCTAPAVSGIFICHFLPVRWPVVVENVQACRYARIQHCLSNVDRPFYYRESLSKPDFCRQCYRQSCS
jgi:hypothetical protein